MDQLLKFLRNSRYCVAFTGAGISTLSGIPDFRGKEGIYQSFDSDKLFDIEYFKKDPSYFYTHAAQFIYAIDKKEPSLVHRQLARLQNAGIIKTVITQNIDLLHQKAGSRRVIELHGSPSQHVCLSCGRHYSFDLISKRVLAGIVPSCDICGGVLKPSITFFGEFLDTTSVDQATREAEKADLMLVCGSSLVVHPAASIPLYTCRAGGTLVIINNMPTPLDHYTALRYNDLEQVFTFIRNISF
ncbi:MAG: NAD-dependent protein deacylase [Chitinivibrionales bacterium]